MEYIDMNSWRRKEHFAFFHALDYPQFNVCVNLDITHFLAFVKENKLSFYYSMMYAACTKANEIENFRYRIRDGRVVLHEKADPSFTDITPGDDLFKYVTAELTGDMLHFTDLAREASRKKTYYMPDPEDEKRDDLIYITCLPLIAFTSISNAIHMHADDSIPRFSWGKYFEENGRVLLPFSVQVNHALADGLQVGQYINSLQNYLDIQ